MWLLVLTCLQVSVVMEKNRKKDLLKNNERKKDEENERERETERAREYPKLVVNTIRLNQIMRKKR